jgi:hypothetical protein
MNTRNNRNESKQRQGNGQKQAPKKQVKKRNTLHGDLNYHEQERIETRMTR